MMSPAAKFHGLISSLTIIVMFSFITYAIPKLLVYATPILTIGGKTSALVAGSVTFLGSVGSYRLLASGLSWLLHRSLKVRRWIFGPSFLHGTWIGFFIGHAGDKRFIIDQFVQDLDGLVINGRSYTTNRQLHGQWVSEATSVDVRRGRLIYTYSFDVGSHSVTLDGICTFQFERTAEYNAPHSITGYAHDLNDPTRIAAQEVKISDALLPWDDALRAAEERFP